MRNYWATSVSRNQSKESFWGSVFTSLEALRVTVGSQTSSIGKPGSSSERQTSRSTASEAAFQQDPQVVSMPMEFWDALHKSFAQPDGCWKGAKTFCQGLSLHLRPSFPSWITKPRGKDTENGNGNRCEVVTDPPLTRPAFTSNGRRTHWSCK